MYNNTFKIYKSFFKKINFKLLQKEIDDHENKNKSILKRKKMSLNLSGLNFMGKNYNQLNKLLKQIYYFKKLRKFFKSNIILNSCSVVNINPSGVNYKRSSIWHRDVKYFKKNLYTDMLLLIVPVTDSLKINGATKFKIKNKIYQPTLFKRDLLVADARLLHKSGFNKTSKKRTIITICITPPHIKPIFDFTKNNFEIQKTPGYLKQLIGFNSRVPGNSKDFFQKDNKKRFFRKDQFN
tara:strand:- start:127 stop:840 length:714 start_codon:yes stop_codon:yes gene_type:complete